MPKWWTTNPSPFSSNTIFPSWPWGHCLLADLTQLFLPCLWPLTLAAVVHAQTFIYSLLPSAMVFEAPVSLLSPTTAPCEAPPSAACVDRAAFMHGTSSSAWLAFSWKKRCLDESMLFFGIFTLCAMQRKPVVMNKCVKHSCFHSPFSPQPCSWPLLPRATWSCKSLVKSVECFQGSIFQKLRAPASQGLLARFTR